MMLENDNGRLAAASEGEGQGTITGRRVATACAITTS